MQRVYKEAINRVSDIKGQISWFNICNWCPANLIKDQHSERSEKIVFLPIAGNWVNKKDTIGLAYIRQGWLKGRKTTWIGNKVTLYSSEPRGVRINKYLCVEFFFFQVIRNELIIIIACWYFFYNKVIIEINYPIKIYI